MMNTVIPIIIPAYEPDERLLELLKTLRKENLNDIIIVNDGSSAKYDSIFSEAKNIIAPFGKILAYPENHGKGYALKFAFRYVLENKPDACGVVTADSDGQHTVECIKKIIKGLQNSPNHLIMGVRQFSGDDIPWKSRFGNNITIKVFQLATGLRVTDTQTGLRGIPRELMKECLSIKENRFEFEMRMLVNCIHHYPVTEIAIKTIYDSKTDHQTHFDPVKDSIKIYKILLGTFFRYMLSSLSSSVIDLVLFSIFCILFKSKLTAYVAVSTVLARVFSSSYNYLMNYKLVFSSKQKLSRSAVKYFTLVIIQMSLSAILVTIGTRAIAVCPEVIIKMVVDTCLFILSYYIQKKFVF